MTKSWEKSQAERYRELANLWQNADRLESTGLERLCTLVLDILGRCAKANLACAEQDVEDLIHAYIVEKVLLPLQTDPDKFIRQMPDSHGALILFFQRFVISATRTPEKRMAARSGSLETEDGEIRHEVDATGRDPGPVDRLHAQGFQAGALVQQAHGFVTGLSPIERVVLQNYCHAGLSVVDLFPGSPQQQALARTAIAHMGLWSGKTRHHDLGSFAQTRLGRFMAEAIGEKLEQSHLPAIEAVMGVVCDVAGEMSV